MPEQALTLAERCEKATEGSRDLDLEILCAITGKPWDWSSPRRDAITWPKYGPGALGNPVCSLEQFTSSLDEVMAIVPEDAGLSLQRYWLRRPEVAWSVVLSTGGVPGNPARQFVAEDAYSAALALCAAALRLRAGDAVGQPSARDSAPQGGDK